MPSHASGRGRRTGKGTEHGRGRGRWARCAGRAQAPGSGRGVITRILRRAQLSSFAPCCLVRYTVGVLAPLDGPAGPLYGGGARCSAAGPPHDQLGLFNGLLAVLCMSASTMPVFGELLMPSGWSGRLLSSSTHKGGSARSRGDGDVEVHSLTTVLTI
jgi:hypothetical protein